MKKIITLSACLIVIALSITGCAGTTAMMSPADLMQVNDTTLCDMFSRRFNPAAREVLSARHPEITDDQWLSIARHEVWVGMSTVALQCSMGRPFDAHRSGGSWGQSTQYVYRRCYSCDASYVYTQNGKVTSWQF